MNSRRKFIKMSALASAAVLTNSCNSKGNSQIQNKESDDNENPIKGAVVVSTWIHGLDANKKAFEVLNAGGSVLDAVEAGVRVIESDPENTSVGIGGYPDIDGTVSLDACIMDDDSNCGAVAFLEGIENPISVARKVMEKTKYVMLVGDGAKQFALNEGFVEKDLRTDKAMKQWEEWKKLPEHNPTINSENHDTIGLLALDSNGKIAGACTTSGMAMKHRGRVGDSPIIGAGLFIDNEVGGACATGVGEAVIRIAGSATVVELMRNGLSPVDACKEAVHRIIRKHKDLTNMQVGFVALNMKGETGGYSVYKNFNYALYKSNKNEMVDAGYIHE